MVCLLCALALAAAPSPRFPQGLDRMQLPAVPLGLTTWASEACANCHEREAQSHALSAHAQARSNFVFQAGVAREAPEWCVGCHAPLSQHPNARAPTDDSEDERGIGCAACHAGTTGVLTTRLSAETPHALELSDELRSGALCAHCHQFGFLRSPHALSNSDPQQDTVVEWQAWQKATGREATCWSCHERGTDHALSGHRPVEALRRAVEVTFEGGFVAVKLLDVGHALPTGDVMRWLSLEFTDDSDGFFDEKAPPAATFGLTLAPHAARDGAFGVRHDTRLHPGQPARIAIPPTAKAVQLVYHLVSAQQERQAALPLSVSRLILHRRSIPGVVSP